MNDVGVTRHQRLSLTLTAGSIPATPTRIGVTNEDHQRITASVLYAPHLRGMGIRRNSGIPRNLQCGNDVALGALPQSD